MAKDIVDVTPKKALNARITLEGEDLVIRVKFKERIGASKSGLSDMIGTTKGNAKISVGPGEEITVGLNVYIAA
jgi:hypothetical protein